MSVQSNQIREPENHTPTPWALRSSGLIVGNLDGNLVFIARLEHTDDQGLVDGGFLLRAANNHDALVEALSTAAPHVCSLLCPSVKRTGEDWTHVEQCKAITAALSAAQEQSQK